MDTSFKNIYRRVMGQRKKLLHSVYRVFRGRDQNAGLTEGGVENM